jgi:hypothetical protein
MCPRGWDLGSSVVGSCDVDFVSGHVITGMSSMITIKDRESNNLFIFYFLIFFFCEMMRILKILTKTVHVVKIIEEYLRMRMKLDHGFNYLLSRRLIKYINFP